MISNRRRGSTEGDEGMFWLFSGIYLGWGLGANDAANVFGTGVASGVVKYRTAVILTAIFVIIGAYFEGSRGITTYGKLSDMDIITAFIASLSAAITINVLTILALPVSTSQAIVGSIIAVGLVGTGINYSVLVKVLLSWVLNPVAAAIISYILYRILGWLLEGKIKNVSVWSLIIITSKAAAMIGGIAIGFGVLTYSKRVMLTVGGRIAHLSDFAALIAVLGQDITVHIFTWIGVPVSTSQAIVGAVMGVGLVKSSKAINFKVIGKIFIGWLSTPAASLIITFVLLMLHHIIL